MKKHTSGFKENIKLYGKELDSLLTFSIDGVSHTLTSEDLNSVVPNFDANMLKSAMKQLDIDSNIDIPKNTVVNYKFGVKVDGEFEYIDYGNYIVVSSEKKEDTNSYQILCYDKMVNSMHLNEDLNITYPIDIRGYITALCNKIDLVFANENDTFANYDKMINEELYVGLEYTYRDILDELAQVTASVICINANDELEIRYPKETNDVIDEEYLNDTNINFGDLYGPINSVVLSRSAESDNVYLRDEESISQNGLCEVKICDNQILNWNDRSDYLPDILEKLNGLSYYVNDFASKGICYYDLYDKYFVQIGDMVYPCLMLKDEVNITQGLSENIYTDLPTETQTDYLKASKDDRKFAQVYLIVDKQNKKIQGLVEESKENSRKITSFEETIDEIKTTVGEFSKSQMINAFKVDLDQQNLIIQTDMLNKPLESKTYDIGYSTEYLSQKVECIPTTENSYNGINLTADDNGIHISVSNETGITLIDNKYTFNFEYEVEGTTYTASKTLIVSLMTSKSDTVQSEEAPEDKTVLWYDVEENVLKRWNGNEWDVVGDYSNDVSTISENINELSEETKALLDSLNNLASELTTYKEEVNTKFTQADNLFSFDFTKLIETLDSLGNVVTKSELEKYIRMVSGKLILGEQNNPYVLTVQNDRLTIEYGEAVHTMMIGDKLITGAVYFKCKDSDAGFGWRPEENGSISFEYLEKVI